MSRVLLVGLPRSGTSWAMNVLATAPGVQWVYEPDNVDAPPNRADGKHGYGPYPLVEGAEANRRYAALWDLAWAGWIPQNRGIYAAGSVFLRFPDAARAALLPLVSRALAVPAQLRRRRRGRDTVLVKSVHALTALDWLCDRYQPRVVVIQRDPLNIVASWLELGIFDFPLWQRADLRAALVEPLGLPPQPRSDRREERVAWCVGLLTSVLADGLRRHPEWYLLTHDSLCLDPEAGFRPLFANLGLAWTPATEEFLKASNRPGEGLRNLNRIGAEQPGRWRQRLPADTIERISASLADFPGRGWAAPTAAPAAVPG